MKGKILFFCVLISSLVLQAQFSFDLEGSYIFGIPYNSVRIPAQGGTPFDLAKDLKVKNSSKYAYRARLSYTIKERHVVSLLFAPLTIKSSGRFKEDVRYSTYTFKENTPIEATYKFNSYRLTYRYLFLVRDHIKAGIGLTGKVRDADIKLQNPEGSANYPDLGVVPLINFYLNWSPGERWMFIFEGDGLVTGKGRAEDFFLGTAYKFSDRCALKAGYRVLEGGADVTNNYNFSFINYASVGILLGL